MAAPALTTWRDWAIGLGNACSGFSSDELTELREIARLYAGSANAVIQLSSWLGDRVRNLFDKVPAGWHDKINEGAELALRASYAAAFNTHPDETSQSRLNQLLSSARGERWHKVSAAVSGAVGGFGGLPTTLADLAVTTTLIMRSIQEIAREHGEDPSDEAVRLSCLAVFGFGGPLAEDDENETGLFATRMALTGTTLAEMMKHVLPRFGIVVGKKTLAQAAPLLGAAAGAAINPAFVGYYQQMAHVHFRLRKLERNHPPAQVQACFERILRTVRQR